MNREPWGISWKDYYQILGIEPGATDAGISDAYRYKAYTLHPDRFTGSPEKVRKRAEDDFKLVNEAYEVLRNAVRRQAYDEERHRRLGKLTPAFSSAASSVGGAGENHMRNGPGSAEIPASPAPFGKKMWGTLIIVAVLGIIVVLGFVARRQEASSQPQELSKLSGSAFTPTTRSVKTNITPPTGDSVNARGFVPPTQTSIRATTTPTVSPVVTPSTALTLPTSPKLPPAAVTYVPTQPPPLIPTSPPSVTIACNSATAESESGRFFRVTSLTMTPPDFINYVHVAGEVENLCNQPLNAQVDVAAVDGEGRVVGSAVIPVKLCNIPPGARASFAPILGIRAPSAVQPKVIIKASHSVLGLDVEIPYVRFCYEQR